MQPKEFDALLAYTQILRNSGSIFYIVLESSALKTIEACSFYKEEDHIFYGHIWRIPPLIRSSRYQGDAFEILSHKYYSGYIPSMAAEKTGSIQDREALRGLEKETGKITFIELYTSPGATESYVSPLLECAEEFTCLTCRTDPFRVPTYIGGSVRRDDQEVLAGGAFGRLVENRIREVYSKSEDADSFGIAFTCDLGKFATCLTDFAEQDGDLAMKMRKIMDDCKVDGF